MTMSVGMAMRRRLSTYLPTRYPLTPCGVEARVVRWRSSTALPYPVPSLRRLFGPVLDGVHLGVPARRNDALQGVGHPRGDLRTCHDRDDHDVQDEDVVRLLEQRGALGRVLLRAEAVDDRVEGRVLVAVVVRRVPVVGLSGGLLAGPAVEVVRDVRVTVVREHLDVGPEVVRTVGRGVGEEDVGRDLLELNLEARCLPVLLHDVLRLLPHGIHRGLVDDVELDAALGADVVRAELPPGVVEHLARSGSVELAAEVRGGRGLVVRNTRDDVAARLAREAVTVDLLRDRLEVRLVRVAELVVHRVGDDVTRLEVDDLVWPGSDWLEVARRVLELLALVRLKLRLLKDVAARADAPLVDVGVRGRVGHDDG